jgi:hypothetical protein
MNMIFHFVLCVVLVLSIFEPVYRAADEDLARREWFKEARCVMFVHWIRGVFISTLLTRVLSGPAVRSGSWNWVILRFFFH